jgi:hypothetical protein
MDWIHLAPDRDQWRGLVNTVVNLLWLYTTLVDLGQGISPSQGRYLHTEHKHRINAHPCLEWDSNS